MRTYGVTDYDIQALVDNELEHEDAERVRQHIERSNNARQRYEQLLKQKALLMSWWTNGSKN